MDWSGGMTWIHYIGERVHFCPLTQHLQPPLCLLHWLMIKTYPIKEWNTNQVSAHEWVFFLGGGIFLGCGGGFPMSSLHHRKLFSLWCFWPKQIPLISLINGAILFTDFWLRGLWTMSATGIFQKCKKCKVFGITDHLKLRNCVRWKIFFFYFMSFNEQHLNPELVIHKCCNLYS